VGGLEGPLLVQQHVEELITEGGLSPRPGAPVARGVLVAAAQGVRAGEGHNLPVREAHATEDVADM